MDDSMGCKWYYLKFFARLFNSVFGVMDVAAVKYIEVGEEDFNSLHCFTERGVT